MGNPLWAIFWLLVLFFIAFGVAGFCAFLYIIIYPLTVCIPGLKSVSDLLLSGIQFTFYCAKAMMDCQPLC